jgi:hypothetical protein
MDSEQDLNNLDVKSALAVIQNELKHINLNQQSNHRDVLSQLKDIKITAGKAYRMSRDNSKELVIINEWRISVDGWRTWVSRTFWGAVITAGVLAIAAIINGKQP